MIKITNIWLIIYIFGHWTELLEKPKAYMFYIRYYKVNQCLD